MWRAMIAKTLVGVRLLKAVEVEGAAILRHHLHPVAHVVGVNVIRVHREEVEDPFRNGERLRR